MQPRSGSPGLGRGETQCVAGVGPARGVPHHHPLVRERRGPRFLPTHRRARGCAATRATAPRRAGRDALRWSDAARCGSTIATRQSRGARRRPATRRGRRPPCRRPRSPRRSRAAARPRSAPSGERHAARQARDAKPSAWPIVNGAFGSGMTEVLLAEPAGVPIDVNCVRAPLTSPPICCIFR